MGVPLLRRGVFGVRSAPDAAANQMRCSFPPKRRDMKPFYLLALLPAVFVCLSVCTGCKPKGLVVHAVEGIVTLDGAPFDRVTITLFPMDQAANMGFAVTDDQGHYRISALGGAIQQGTTVGTHKVTFSKMIDDGRGGGKDIVPRKYQMPDTSGFELTVEKGKNVYNFDLFSK